MSERKRPVLTVDAIIRLEDGRIVLIKRKNPPFEGWWALPGGIVEYGERVEDAVKREAWEETGIDIKIEKLVGIYSDPNRDPRGHFISICYLCSGRSEQMRAATDAAEVAAFHPDEIKKLKLAFDHRKMLKDAGII
ncbi:MAG: NUDIX domain-containing protein [Candidatus Baldrarchaeia archaeon]